MIRWLRYRAATYLGFALARMGVDYVSCRHPGLRFRVSSTPHYTRLFRLIDRVPCGALARRRPCGAASQPHWLPVTLPELDDLTRTPEILGDLTDKLRSTPELRVLFDLSGEAVPDDARFRQFHDDLQRMGIPAASVCLLNANAGEGFYEAWRARHGVDYRITLVHYHFHIYAVMHKLANHPWFLRNRAKLALAAKAGLTSPDARPKYFLSLNWRAREHRTALLLTLLSREHLDKGYVSYLGDYAADFDMPEEKYLDGVAALLEPTGSRNEAMALLPTLKSMRPIVFERTPEAMKGMQKTPTEITYIIPELQLHGGELRIDTWFEVVSETYMGGREALYITEKTLRPLLRFQPFIYLGPPHMLRELKRLGFRSFSPLIDETYDTLEDPGARFATAMSELDRLCRMQPAELHTLYRELWSRVEHNFNHLCDGFPTMFKQDVEENIFRKLA